MIDRRRTGPWRRYHTDTFYIPFPGVGSFLEDKQHCYPVRSFFFISFRVGIYDTVSIILRVIAGAA